MPVTRSQPNIAREAARSVQVARPNAAGRTSKATNLKKPITPLIKQSTRTAIESSTFNGEPRHRRTQTKTSKRAVEPDQTDLGPLSSLPTRKRRRPDNVETETGGSPPKKSKSSQEILVKRSTRERHPAPPPVPQLVTQPPTAISLPSAKPKLIPRAKRRTTPTDRVAQRPPQFRWPNVAIQPLPGQLPFHLPPPHLRVHTSPPGGFHETDFINIVVEPPIPPSPSPPPTNFDVRAFRAGMRDGPQTPTEIDEEEEVPEDDALSDDLASPEDNMPGGIVRLPSEAPTEIDETEYIPPDDPRSRFYRLAQPIRPDGTNIEIDDTLRETSEVGTEIDEIIDDLHGLAKRHTNHPPVFDFDEPVPVDWPLQSPPPRGTLPDRPILRKPKTFPKKSWNGRSLPSFSTPFPGHERGALPKGNKRVLSEVLSYEELEAEDVIRAERWKTRSVYLNSHPDREIRLIGEKRVGRFHQKGRHRGYYPFNRTELRRDARIKRAEDAEDDERAMTLAAMIAEYEEEAWDRFHLDLAAVRSRYIGSRVAVDRPFDNWRWFHEIYPTNGWPAWNGELRTAFHEWNASDMPFRWRPLLDGEEEDEFGNIVLQGNKAEDDTEEMADTREYQLAL